MKNMKKMLLTMAAMLTLVFAMQISANAAVYFKGCTKDSFTISWDAATNTDGTLLGYRIKDVNDNVLTEVGSAVTSYKFNGLKNGIDESVWLYACYYDENYPETDCVRERYQAYCYVNTLPATIPVKNFAVTASNLKQKTFTVRANYQGDGFQVQYTNLATKKVKTVNPGKYYTSATLTSVAADTAYAIKVRPYVVNRSNNKTYYGAWSAPKYDVLSSAKVGATSKRAGINVVLKKGKGGIKSYTVYTSTREDGGYKKVGTYKVTTKTKTIYITKNGKKKMKPYKTYYVKVVPNLSIGGKSVKAAASVGHIYPFK